MLSNNDPPAARAMVGAGVATPMTETVEVTVCGIEVTGIMIVGVAGVGVTESSGVVEGVAIGLGMNRVEGEGVARIVDALTGGESPGIGFADRVEDGNGGKLGGVREAVGVGRSGTAAERIRRVSSREREKTDSQKIRLQTVHRS